jgi:hypothetical protein
MDVAMNAHGVRVERRLGRPVMSSYHGMFSLGGLVGAGLAALLLPFMPPLTQALLLAAAGLASPPSRCRISFRRAWTSAARGRLSPLPGKASIALGALTSSP